MNDAEKLNLISDELIAYGNSFRKFLIKTDDANWLVTLAYEGLQRRKEKP